MSSVRVWGPNVPVVTPAATAMGVGMLNTIGLIATVGESPRTAALVVADSFADQAVSSGIHASSPVTSPSATLLLALATICTAAQAPGSGPAAAYVEATWLHTER